MSRPMHQRNWQSSIKPLLGIDGRSSSRAAGQQCQEQIRPIPQSLTLAQNDLPALYGRRNDPGRVEQSNGSLFITENCSIEMMRGINMIDYCLSALATAWFITFVATTGLATAVAVESAWDRELYSRLFQDDVTPGPLSRCFPP